MPLTLLDNFTIVISALRVIPSKISPSADIAQLVEQRIRNAKVVGSTPIIGTIKIKLLRKILSFSHQKIILM